MIAIGAAVSAIVLAMAPGARQVVQTGPTGPMAVSKSGYVAVVDGADTLHIYHLASRTLVRSIAAATLNGDSGLVNPIIPRWDDTTNEVVLPRGNDVLRVAVDGTLTTSPFQASRLWPVGGGGKARWIIRQYGDAEVVDASWTSLGKLANSEQVVAAADGKSALVVAKDATLHRFTLDPVAKHSTIKLPAPADDSMSGTTIAVTADGTTAAVCLKTPKDYQAVLVRGLDKQATVTPIKFDGGMAGCEVAIAELHGIVVVADPGDMRGFDLATGALRWQAPRGFLGRNATASEVAVSGRTVLVSWQGLMMLDVVRGDVIGQIGTDIARPEQLHFLRGDQLLTVRQNPASIFGATGVALANWSLKDGLRTNTGTAMWGYASRLAEDGTLITARPPTDSNVLCWTFSKGTAGDGAALSKDPVKGAWPPAPGKSTATCLPKPMSIEGIDLSTGALATMDRTDHLIIPAKGNPVTLQGTPRRSLRLAFSPDGKWVMGTNMFGGWASLLLWDVKDGKLRKFTASATDPEGISIAPGAPKRKGYNAHAVSVDSQQIAIAGSDTVTLYTLATQKPVRTFTLPSSGHATAVAMSGAVIVAGTSDGRLVVSRGARVTEAASDGGALTSIVVRADGKRAATISDDGAVRIWDLAKPALLVTLVDASDGEAFASTPGGAYAGGREAAEQLGWIFDGPTEGFKFERFAGLLARPDLVARRLADATTDLNVAIARPPRVTITSQPPPKGTMLKLGAKVESAGTVKLVRAFVNGRAVASVPVDAPSKDIVIDVALEAGSNVVTLVAFDDAGRSSNPRSVDVGTALATARPDVWVIAAGVGWYPNLPVEDQLEGSVNDAYAIADAFDGQAGPGKRYDKAHITVLEDEQVTAAALDKALAQLAQMKPTDVAIVFLAGHGVRLPKTEDMVLLTGAAKLDKSTWATSGIGWTKIGTALAKAKGRVIVLLDACHAGNVTQERIVPNTQLADDLVSSQRAGVLVFAASKGSQKSLETNAARAVTLDEDQKVLVQHKRVPKKKPPPPPPPQTTPTAPRERRGNGYFTGAVVAALDSPVTDINRDGVVQTAELITQVQLRVLRASRGKQTPWVARRELFGDFALATATK